MLTCSIIGIEKIDLFFLCSQVVASADPPVILTLKNRSITKPIKFDGYSNSLCADQNQTSRLHLKGVPLI